jgi:hypothetical protein
VVLSHGARPLCAPSRAPAAPPPHPRRRAPAAPPPVPWGPPPPPPPRVAHALSAPRPSAPLPPAPRVPAARPCPSGPAHPRASTVVPSPSAWLACPRRAPRIPSCVTVVARCLTFGLFNFKFGLVDVLLRALRRATIHF